MIFINGFLYFNIKKEMSCNIEFYVEILNMIYDKFTYISMFNSYYVLCEK